jgi:hypothetical protein
MHQRAPHCGPAHMGVVLGQEQAAQLLGRTCTASDPMYRASVWTEAFACMTYMSALPEAGSLDKHHAHTRHTLCGSGCMWG